MSDDWIPDKTWRTIMAQAPIVSVDLLVHVNNGLVFGKQTNEPAEGYWFVPGGRLEKGETREEAVHRVAREELGVNGSIVESQGRMNISTTRRTSIAWIASTTSRTATSSMWRPRDSRETTSTQPPRCKRKGV